MQRHQAAFHRHLGKMADTPQVVAVAQRHDAAAVLLGALQRQLHGLFAHDLAIAALAIERQQAADIDVDLGGRIRLQAAFGNRVHIPRHHAHAVGVMAAQIGEDQVGRDGPGFGGSAAAGLQDAGHQRLQRRGLQCFLHWGFSYMTAPSCQGTNSFWP